MIEWSLGQVRKQAVENLKRALQEGRGGVLDVARQILAIDEIVQTSKDVLRNFGVADIPLPADQIIPPSSSPTPEEIVLQEGIPTHIEQVRPEKRLDIIQEDNEDLKFLELSRRTHNTLKRSGLIRVKDILQMPDQDLLRVRNFGFVSLEELKEKLREHLPRLEDKKRTEREREGKRNKDPHTHVGRILENASTYKRQLFWRQQDSQQPEEQPDSEEFLKAVIERYLRTFGFIKFTEENIDKFEAYMAYTQGIGRIATRQGLSVSKQNDLYLHFLAHIALGHEDQAASPQVSARFEKKDRETLDAITREEEKEADEWVNSLFHMIKPFLGDYGFKSEDTFAKAINHRIGTTGDVPNGGLDDDLDNLPEPNPRSKRSIHMQKRLDERGRLLITMLRSSQTTMDAMDLVTTAAETYGAILSYTQVNTSLKLLCKTGQVRREGNGRGAGYRYSIPE